MDVTIWLSRFHDFELFISACFYVNAAIHYRLHIERVRCHPFLFPYETYNYPLNNSHCLFNHLSSADPESGPARPKDNAWA